MSRRAVTAQMLLSVAAVVFLFVPWHDHSAEASFPCLAADCHTWPASKTMVTCLGISHFGGFEAVAVVLSLLAPAVVGFVGLRRALGYAGVVLLVASAALVGFATFWALVSADLAHLFMSVRHGLGEPAFGVSGAALLLLTLGHAVMAAVRRFRERRSMVA